MQTTIEQPTQEPLTPTKKQWQLIKAIKSGLYRFILIGGAISTAKSVGIAIVILSMAKQFPNTRYGVFRKNRLTLKRTTYQTFKKVARWMGLVEKRDYKANLTDLMWEFANGSEIWFMELDETKDPDFDKIKGLELTAAAIDEVNECAEEGVRVVATRVGRQNYNNEPQFVVMSCNPADNWVRDVFYTPYIKDKLQPPYLFIPSLPEDNPYNSAEYIAGLKANPPQFVKRYVEGNWDFADDENALFRNIVIERAVKPIKGRGDRFIGADIARAGQDNTVFCLIENGMLVDLYVPDIDKDDDQAILINVGDELIRYMNQNQVGYRYTTVDSNGLGEGVRDYLISKGYHVNGFKSGSTEGLELHDDETPKFDMLRSQRYWNMARAMETGAFTIWQGLPNFEDLRRDLLAHEVEITDKMIKVESKALMRKRLGRSPDFGDAVMMAFDATPPAGLADISAGGTVDDWWLHGDDED